MALGVVRTLKFVVGLAIDGALDVAVVACGEAATFNLVTSTELLIGFGLAGSGIGLCAARIVEVAAAGIVEVTAAGIVEITCGGVFSVPGVQLFFLDPLAILAGKTILGGPFLSTFVSGDRSGFAVGAGRQATK